MLDVRSWLLDVFQFNRSAPVSGAATCELAGRLKFLESIVLATLLRPGRPPSARAPASAEF